MLRSASVSWRRGAPSHPSDAFKHGDTDAKSGSTHGAITSRSANLRTRMRVAADNTP